MSENKTDEQIANLSAWMDAFEASLSYHRKSIDDIRDAAKATRDTFASRIEYLTDRFELLKAIADQTMNRLAALEANAAQPSAIGSIVDAWSAVLRENNGPPAEQPARPMAATKSSRLACPLCGETIVKRVDAEDGSVAYDCFGSCGLLAVMVEPVRNEDPDDTYRRITGQVQPGGDA